METVDNMACASNRVFVGDMPTQLKSIIQKVVPKRRTYVVAAAFVKKDCPKVHDDTTSLAELAKLANALRRRAWNTFHMVSAKDVKSLYDTNFTGVTVNVIVSLDDSVSVLVKGAKQPMVFETFEEELITCEGGKGEMWLTRFGDDTASRQLDDF